MFTNSYNAYTVNPINGKPIMFFVEAINASDAYVKAIGIMRAQFDCFFGRIDLTIVEM